MFFNLAKHKDDIYWYEKSDILKRLQSYDSHLVLLFNTKHKHYELWRLKQGVSTHIIKLNDRFVLPKIIKQYVYITTIKGKPDNRLVGWLSMNDTHKNFPDFKAYCEYLTELDKQKESQRRKGYFNIGEEIFTEAMDTNRIQSGAGGVITPEKVARSILDGVN